MKPAFGSQNRKRAVDPGETEGTTKPARKAAERRHNCNRPRENPGKSKTVLERETGFEPATSTLARLHSTN